MAALRSLLCLLLGLSAASFSTAQALDNGKIKGTGGVSSISGSAGGGLIPWATLGSHAAPGENGARVFATGARVDDYDLNVIGAAVNFQDRVELSIARQDFRIRANDTTIRQDRLGLRFKLAGHLLYGRLPQITLGLEHGRLRDEATALAVGADETRGTDYSVSVGKAWLDGIGRRTTMVNVNLRHSRANQYGLLGWDGDAPDTRWQVEAAGAVFLTRNLVLGAEYRQKPDNLSALDEQSARDLFLAWLPDKRFAVTAAWLDLGRIAGAPDQTGFYLSLQANF